MKQKNKNYFFYLNFRQQTEFKQQLCKTDTPTIARIVGGCRRKDNEDRFYIGGMDISFIKDNNVDACACFSVVRMPDLEVNCVVISLLIINQKPIGASG